MNTLTNIHNEIDLELNYKKTMTKSIILVVMNLLAFHSFGQECKKIDSQENIITIPNWLLDNERETIRKIEAQNIIDWSDYIQLAISYSELNADQSKIEKLVSYSLKKNTSDACKFLNFILENRKSWNITYKYSEIVIDQLKNYGCYSQ